MFDTLERHLQVSCSASWVAGAETSESAKLKISMIHSRIALDLVMISLFSLGGCIHVGPISGPLREQSCIGGSYVLNVDCYVVRPPWEDRTLLLSPDHARHYGLPVPVREEHVGGVFHGEQILGVISRGTVFRVEDIIRIQSAEYDILMPMVRIIHEGVPQGEGLNAHRLFSGDTGRLEIIPAYGRRWEAPGEGGNQENTFPVGEVPKKS